MGKFLVCIALFFFIPAELFAEVDDLKVAIQKERPSFITWENVKGSPYYLEGVKPLFRFSKNYHTITLAQGEHIAIQIPSGENIRLISQNSKKGVSLPRVFLSNGSALYEVKSPLPTKIKNVFFIHVDRSLPSIIFLENKKTGSDKKITFRLYISKTEFPPSFSLYPEEVTGGQRKPVICAKGTLCWKEYHTLSPEQSEQLTITGPARIKLETRLSYKSSTVRLLKDTYQVYVLTNGKEKKTFDIETLPVANSPFYIENNPEILGQTRNIYLNLPKGSHLIDISASKPLYFRVLKTDKQRFLLPELNTPQELRFDIPLDTFTTESKNKSPVDLFKNPSLPGIDKGPPSAIFKRAQYLASVAYIGSGSRTALDVLTTAFSDNNSTELEDEINRFKSGNTFFHNLLPINSDSGHIPQPAYFIPRKLLPLTSAEQEYYFLPKYTSDLLKTLGRGLFSTLSPQKNSLIYQLEESTSPGDFRLLVNKNNLKNRKSMFLQIDNNPPMEFELLIQPKIPLTYAPYPAEAALGTLCMEKEEQNCSTFYGKFVSLKSPGEIIPVGYVDFSVPAGAKKITVYSIANSQQISIGLQLKNDKKFILSEKTYYHELTGLGQKKPMNLFIDFLNGSSSDKEKSLFTGLYNNWVPIIRALRRYRNIFIAPIAKRGSRKKQRVFDQAKLYKLIKKAEILEKSKNSIEALEVWTQIQNHSEGKTKNRAEISRVRNLFALGNHYFAEILLKQLFYAGENISLRQEAFIFLSDYYRGQGDIKNQLRLYSAALFQNPSKRIIRSLASLFLEKGNYSFALSLILLTPQENRDLKIRLHASLQKQWWHTFEEALLTMQSKKKVNYWKGMQALKKGDAWQAISFFENDGHDGKVWSEYIKKEYSVFKQLNSSKQENRTNGITAWEKHYQKYPGNWTWKKEVTHGHVVRRSVKNRDDNTIYQMDEVRQNTQNNFTLYGPTRAKFTIRPIYKKNNKNPAIRWVLLTIDHTSYRIPFLDNKTSDYLGFVDDELHVPGLAESENIYISPGIHEITLSSKDLSFLFTVSTLQHEISVPILPALHTKSIIYAKKGFPKNISLQHCDNKNCFHLLEKNGKEKPFSIQLQKNPLPTNHSVIPADRHFQQPTEKVNIATCLSLGDQLKTKPDKQYALQTDTQKNAVINQMRCFLWLSEHDKKNIAEIQVVAEKIYNKNRNSGKVRFYLGRIREKTRWKRMDGVQSSGIRRIERQGWSPASPTLRTYNNFIPPLDPKDYVLYGNTNLVLILNNLGHAQFDFSVSEEMIDLFQDFPVTILYSLDGGLHKEILFTPEKRKIRFYIHIPNGEHSLRFWIENPIPFQFVRLRITEPFRSESSERQHILNVLEHRQKIRYHISTRREPIKFFVDGVTQVRVDILKDSTITNRFINVEAGLHEIIIPPDAGEKEMVARIYKLQKSIKKPLRAKKSSPQVSEELTSYAYLTKNVTGKKRNRRLITYPSSTHQGWLEPGTWSVTPAWVRRNRLPEEDKNTQAEQFTELNLTHRFFSETRKLYFNTRLLKRIREVGGSTTGIMSEIFHPLSSNNLFFNLRNTFYFQRPVTSYKKNSSTNLEWAGNMTASLFQKRRLRMNMGHVPKLFVFKRFLSMDPNLSPPDRSIDHNIFSQYKNSHQYGFKIEDKLSYTPFLDTRINVLMRLTSNEWNTFSLFDNLRLSASWIQLAGDFRIGFRYNMLHYFNDDERKRYALQNNILLKFAWEKFLTDNSRLEIGGRIRSEFDGSGSTAKVYLSWHFGKGKRFKDFAPDEIIFRKLRDAKGFQLTHDQMNND